MSTPSIVLQGELAKAKLPKDQTAAIDKLGEHLGNRDTDEIDAMIETLGIELEGVSGLIPFTYNSITVFAGWNSKGPSVDIYAVGTGSSVYLLVTFKSTMPTSYRLDATARELVKVSPSPSGL